VTEEERSYLAFAHVAEALLESGEWRAFKAAAQERLIESWANKAIAPCRTQEQVLEREHQKGTLFGITLTLQYPEWIVAEKARILKDAADRGEAVEDDDGRDASGGSDDSSSDFSGAVDGGPYRSSGFVDPV